MPATSAPRAHFLRLLLAISLSAFVAPRADASGPPTESLGQLNAAIQSLVQRVSPSVVQVMVTGYGPIEEGGAETDVVIGRQRSLGSGVIIDPDGFIITNAHVVAGARRVQIALPPASQGSESPLRSLVGSRGQTVDATVLGVAREVDLALLKVELTGLPALRLANYDDLRQGELVFAFGSPEGLRNSVTMGVVSAVARQPDADHPMVYIQTDAPINHGNSGGPLVNVKGEIVGINAFILSDSGGSQGLGFAIPSAVVGVAYPQLRQYGHLHRGEIGVEVQTITPELAKGLGLARNWGIVVSDLAPDGPSEDAGVKIEDVIVSADGVPIDSLLQLAFHLYTKNVGDTLTLRVLRGADQVDLNLPVVEHHDGLDKLADLVDPDRSRIRQLGVLGMTIDSTVASYVPDLRVPSGVLVAARAQEPRAADVSLSTGDVIHKINGIAITTLQELRGILNDLPPRSDVVLQIERDGKLTFVVFQLD